MLDPFHLQRINKLSKLTHYSLVLLFNTPWKLRKPIGFLMFSGGVENNTGLLNQSVYSLQITQNEHLLIWNSETIQSLNIYLYNYQSETAIFLATKHEKTIMASSYLNFYKCFLHFELLASNTIKWKYSSKFLAP